MNKTLEQMINEEEYQEEKQMKYPKQPKSLTYESIKDFLDIPANQMKQKKKQHKDKETNEYQVYKSYERKIQWIDADKMKEDYLQYKNNPSLQIQRSNGMINDEQLKQIQLHMKKGKKLADSFHRKRKQSNSSDFSNDFINKQNEYFNKYVNKAYNHYTVDIKDALEHV